MALSDRCKRPDRSAEVVLREGMPLRRRRGAAKGKRRPAKRGDEIRLDMRAQDTWAYTIRADTILGAAATELIKFYRKRVQQGITSDTGKRQPPLKRPGRGPRKGGRGYKTGLFADTIRMTEVKGRTDLARVRILPDTRRNVFVSMEATRGVEYFAVQGDAAKVIEDAVNEVLDCELQGHSERKAARARRARDA